MRTEKDLLLGFYLDEYGTLLTEKQAAVAAMYYREDLSLSEVARELNVSRQGALDTLSRARRRLYKLEEELHLVQKRKETTDGI